MIYSKNCLFIILTVICTRAAAAAAAAVVADLLLVLRPCRSHQLTNSHIVIFIIIYFSNFGIYFCLFSFFFLHLVINCSLVVHFCDF